jgi:hypothetical protein
VPVRVPCAVVGIGSCGKNAKAAVLSCRKMERQIDGMINGWLIESIVEKGASVQEHDRL